MKNIIGAIIGILLLICVVYGGYWVAKNVSYSLFYEEMVLETIKETVKPQYLKELSK